MSRKRSVWLPLIGGGVLLTVLFPYAIMLITSVKSNDDLYSLPPRIIPKQWELGNYLAVWSESKVGEWLLNSVVISTSATLLTLAITVPGAYFLATHQFRGRRLVMVALLVTQMITPTIVLIGLYRQLLSWGLVNTQLALIVTNVGFNACIAVWLMTAFFRTVPTEVFEAARLDGCSEFRTMVQIVMPISAPGLVTTAVFVFINAWNEYVVALLVIRDDGRLPLSVGITSFIGQYNVQWQLLFAVGIISILPVVVLFMAVEKNLINGLAAGAVK